MQMTARSDVWTAIRAGSMYFYSVGMWTRAEDPCNRTFADMFVFNTHRLGVQVSTHFLTFQYTCLTFGLSHSVLPTFLAQPALHLE